MPRTFFHFPKENVSKPQVLEAITWDIACQFHNIDFTINEQISSQ